jgi:hypothetical protein
MATNTIKLSDELETRIRDALAPLHPEKVILFGSYAWGQPTADSDIDLYVVTQDASEIRRNGQQLRPPDHERGGPPAMKRASGQWLESAEMDLGSIDQIVQREGYGVSPDRFVKCQALTPKAPWSIGSDWGCWRISLERGECA